MSKPITVQQRVEPLRRKLEVANDKLGNIRGMKQPRVLGYVDGQEKQ